MTDLSSEVFVDTSVNARINADKEYMDMVKQGKVVNS